MILEKLRQYLKQEGLAGFLVPMADPYQNEYILPSYGYLQHLTGFSGSAGLGIVGLEKAALFVDGRYWIQARNQVDPQSFDILDYKPDEIQKWLQENISGPTGFDPWLHTEKSLEMFSNTRPVANPFPALWQERPPLPQSPGFLLDLAFAGKSAQEKCQEMGALLKAKGKSAQFLADMTSIAWLLNMRGHDLPCTPIVCTHGILHATGRVDLFAEPGRIPPQPGLVTVHSPETLQEHIQALEDIVFPPETPYVLSSLKENPCFERDLIALPKARKNSAEQQGFRDAHVLDGVALTRFLYALAQNPDLDEVTAADALESYRASHLLYRGPSFKTISAVGENAALPHYQTSPETNKRLTPGALYLVDSGGQYPLGTTDVTRTVALGGNPTDLQKHHFTLVLKGHIALASSRFKKDTTGAQLDILARQFLLQEGLDYNHGTGHGVGHFLNVHEGPQNISSNPRNLTALEAGMVISNEPGFYQEGHYGIRLENLVLVVEEAGMLAFETLTLAPFDLSLVEWEILTPGEKTWLHTYHRRIQETLGPHLTKEENLWLSRQTPE